MITKVSKTWEELKWLPRIDLNLNVGSLSVPMVHIELGGKSDAQDVDGYPDSKRQ